MVGDEEVELGLEEGEEGEDWGKGGKERKRFYKKENEEVLQRLLYAVDYCSFGQAYSACYQDYTKRGFEDRMVRAEAAGLVRIYRKYLFPERLAEFDPWGKLRGPKVENRDELVKILYLGPEGERWCKENLRGYHKAHLAKPKDNNQWTHDLSVSRLLIEMLSGSVKERRQVLKELDWVTGSRGATFKLGRSGNVKYIIRTITPDSVVTAPTAKERVFLELDRSTKKLSAKEGSPHYGDTIQATLDAYKVFFRDRYQFYYPDGKKPFVLYVVPDEKRRQSIERLSQIYNGWFDVRVRTLQEGAGWLQGLFGDNIDLFAPAQNANSKIAPHRDAEVTALTDELTKLKQLLQRKNKLIGSLRDRVVDTERRLAIWKGALHSVLRHGAVLRKAGEDWTVPEHLEPVMANILQAPRKKSLLGKIVGLVERQD